MRISFNTPPSSLNLDTGYGLGGYGIVTSMQRCGYTVGFVDSGAPVEFAFCMPDNVEWSNPDAYHIQCTPWESTKLMPGWVEKFNACDEVWATSEWVAGIYKAEGVTVPIYVYEHGVGPEWVPRRRRQSPVLKFLHVGEPALRKGGQMALDAFRDAFGDASDVHLTIKAWNKSNLRVFDRQGSIIGLPHNVYNNVTSIYDNFSEEGMVNIFLTHHALVYPSMGEGFGLIPLQALATGMPTICTEVWAPYARFLEPQLSLSSTLVDSQWTGMHPGQMYKPSYDDLKAAYIYTKEHYDQLAGAAYRRAFDIRTGYDWDYLTNNVFAHIVERFG